MGRRFRDFFDGEDDDIELTDDEAAQAQTSASDMAGFLPDGMVGRPNGSEYGDGMFGAQVGPRNDQIHDAMYRHDPNQLNATQEELRIRDYSLGDLSQGPGFDSFLTEEDIAAIKRMK